MSAKEMLYREIQKLSEEEACRVLDAVMLVKQTEIPRATWSRLAGNPSIELAAGGSKPSRDFEPTKGRGIPASQFLIKDRR